MRVALSVCLSRVTKVFHNGNCREINLSDRYETTQYRMGEVSAWKKALNSLWNGSELESFELLLNLICFDNFFIII